MANYKNTPQLVLKGVPGEDITWSNFSGKASKNNTAGNRNFTIRLPRETAEDLIAAGWKVFEARDGNGDPEYRIEITVSYRFEPPKIRTYTGRKETMITEASVGDLDQVMVESMDIWANGWESTSRDGRKFWKPYLKSLRVKVAFIDDPFEDDYEGYVAEDVVNHSVDPYDEGNVPF